ncbi:helix-turn-helix transcriptional regulator [Marinimicrobium alkaliphilum]|uniref:helix-turn-helix transcriptional regulator n=1 Tax=Marinimicrobium alkaliphilum TaxID=2202654 RepID=UPI000DB8FF0D|nr:helix-turn-helix transcriptional regulator [Marinimicrobium alkaliphilum]
MQINDQLWLSLVDSFSAAAVGTGSWLDSLSQLADATGSRAGELIGLGSANTVPFNWVSGLCSEWAEDFLACGGGDPGVNPFVRAGSQLSVLQVASSAEFVSAQERRSNRFIAEHTQHYDIPYICLTPLVKERDSLVGLAVMRSGKQGEITDAQKALFTSIAPHIRAAVRTQMALEHQSDLLAAGTLEALSLAVFICDRRGHVKAVTPRAEELLGQQDCLRLRGGVLGAATQTDSRLLTNAIGTAAAGLRAPGAPLATTLVLKGKRTQPYVVEVLPVPRREYAFGFEPRVLVVARDARVDSSRMQLLLRAAFGLTLAEADVAQQLAEGNTTEAIALQRGSSLGTVRTQIRAIYNKLDVHRVSELVARLQQLR